MLEVYNDATPNGLKVSIALEELALQYNIHRIFLGGEQLTPEFTKLNPNQKIPVLVDSDQGIVLTESGAILLYLAEKTGKLLPKDIKGRTKTGLTIFRPSDGLDEGLVLLRKEVGIGPDDTLGTVYFERLFPMGIAALQEAADLVMSGRATSTVQDEAQASYEGWCRDAEARINWHNHVDMVYNLIRGCNPAPAAWTVFKDKKLQLFDARKHPARTFSEVKGKIGTVTHVSDRSLFVTAQGGQIEVFALRSQDGKKLKAPEFCADTGLAPGAVLGA